MKDLMNAFLKVYKTSCTNFTITNRSFKLLTTEFPLNVFWFFTKVINDLIISGLVLLLLDLESILNVFCSSFSSGDFKIFRRHSSSQELRSKHLKILLLIQLDNNLSKIFTSNCNTFMFV